MEIGRFFVDRKVPDDNFYWKDRYLYIVPMPGYLFIPIFADLQRRAGLPKSEILNETNVRVVEQILNAIGKEEFSGQRYSQHIRECIEIVTPHCKNKLLIEELSGYFLGENEDQGYTTLKTPFRALSRVDSYLYTLCSYALSEVVKVQLVNAWHALMNFYLILDDLDDISEDLVSGEPNAIIEAGLHPHGAKRIEEVLRDSYDTMNAINPVFANRMDFSLEQLDVYGIIAEAVGEKK